MPPPVRALALAAAGPVLAGPVLAGAILGGGIAAAAGDLGVAIVRRDGRLQPLASLAADGWTPLAAGGASGPWHLWLFDDPAVKASPFTMRSARRSSCRPGWSGCSRRAVRAARISRSWI